MAKAVTVSKWGNAQGIRLPDAFCRQLGISVGDKVFLAMEQNRLVITSANEQYTLQARLEAWKGSGTPEPEYDWGQPVGREMW
ncbi:MAG: AbrB/MazE/SpoVT family DNA-binding domain-containing protein [Synergistaceae bacterium]|jgi:antitoxin MazE|nr:AbrB/MazE/SpoVT family DNA-binding domain-containing protein [Synergistaceae bacterium]